MLFNSLKFAIFFPVVTTLYFALPHRARWALLLLASCVFYVVAVPAYIGVLALTITVDYWAAIRIEQSLGARRRRFLVASVVSTCVILFIFKYLNFFDDSAAWAARAMGYSYDAMTVRLLVPIGLSFHTFQSLSYVIEVYRGNQRAERHFGIYSLYVMFFPQLVAGPIERPQRLLHQFREEHHFEAERVRQGIERMGWGFVKKSAIADRLAPLVNVVYDNPHASPGLPALTATILFAFQIYCDFSGYSDIAMGSAQVMGFRLSRNFDRPYFATSLGDFWRRWHISLSTWFRDYVYIPLGGRTGGRWRHARNIMLTFALSGLWHGAAWTFVFWGLVHGAGLAISSALTAQATASAAIPGKRLWKRLATFAFVCAAWILFRARSLPDALFMFRHLGVAVTQVRELALGTLGNPRHVLWLDQPSSALVIALLLIGILLLAEWWSTQPRGRRVLTARRPLVRWAASYACLLVIILLGVFRETRFIYFQF